MWMECDEVQSFFRRLSMKIGDMPWSEAKAIFFFFGKGKDDEIEFQHFESSQGL